MPIEPAEMNGLKLYLFLVEEAERLRSSLMGKIAADLALAGLRIVGCADPRDQQELDIEQLERAQQH
jgi:hypothetical protein